VRLRGDFGVSVNCRNVKHGYSVTPKNLYMYIYMVTLIYIYLFSVII